MEASIGGLHGISADEEVWCHAAVLCIYTYVRVAYRPARVRGPAAPSKDEKNLDKELAGCRPRSGNRTANARPQADPGGFQGPMEQLQKVLDQGLGYGEAAIVLSIAQTWRRHHRSESPEGHFFPPGLRPQAGAVARRFNVKLGRIVSQVRKINNESHRTIKQDMLRPRPPRSPAPRGARPPHPPQEQLPGRRQIASAGPRGGLNRAMRNSKCGMRDQLREHQGQTARD